MTKVIPDPAYFIVQMVVQGQRTPPKKVLKPKTLSVLKKQVNQAFKPEKRIRSFLREDGTVVKTLDDLDSGTVLIASYRSRKETEDHPELTYQEIEDMEFIGRQQLHATNLTSFIAGGRGRGSKQVSVSFQSPIGPTRVRSGRESDWGSVARSRSTHASRLDSGWLEDSVGGQSTTTRKRFANVKLSELHHALNDLIGDDIVFSSLDRLINESDKKDLLMKLLPLEKEQSHAWYQAVINQPMLIDRTQGISIYENVKRYATDMLSNHRFLSGKWVNHRIRLGIVGPRGSGKSVLLAEIVSQLAAEMVYTGEWKSTFVFAFDVVDFLPLLNEYSQLLELMVNQVLDAIAAQKPSFLESLQTLKRKLTAATKFGAIEPPASTWTPFDPIAKRLSDSWRQDDAFYDFFLTIFQLPIQLSKAAGFETALLVVDNLDRADLELWPTPPFIEQDDYVYFAELLKFALDGTNFVISCENTKSFLQLMVPTDEEGIDLLDGISLASTMDIQDHHVDENHGDRFAVDVDGDDLPLVLHIGLCGGVVHFLVKWKTLCDLMNRLESCPQGDEFDNVQFSAIHAAQEFVSLVFNPVEPNDEIHVTNVVRLHETSQF
jgi:hypothetical protein